MLAAKFVVSVLPQKKKRYENCGVADIVVQKESLWRSRIKALHKSQIAAPSNRPGFGSLSLTVTC